MTKKYIQFCYTIMRMCLISWITIPVMDHTFLDDKQQNKNN